MQSSNNDRRKRRNLRGWKPEIDHRGIPRKYWLSLDSNLDTLRDPDLSQISSCLRSSASDSADPNSEIFRRPEKSNELRNLINRRRSERRPEEMKILSHQILRLARKELRAWRSLWANHLLKKFRNTRFLQKINEDPIQKKHCPIEDDNFAEYLEKLYAEEHPISSMIDKSLLWKSRYFRRRNLIKLFGNYLISDARIWMV